MLSSATGGKRGTDPFGRLTISAFARWSGFSRGFVQSLLKAKRVPYYDGVFGVRIDPVEFVEFVGTRCFRGPGKLKAACLSPERFVRSRDGGVLDCPFVGLRAYSKQLALGDEREVRRIYMQLYRRVKSESIPSYKLAGQVFVDPIEMNGLVWNSERVRSMEEIFIERGLL